MIDRTNVNGGQGAPAEDGQTKVILDRMAGLEGRVHSLETEVNLFLLCLPRDFGATDFDNFLCNNDINC